MAIYLINPLVDDPTALNAAIERAITDPADRYRLQANRGWLVKFPGTSVELSNHIGLTGQPTGTPPLGSALVIPFTAYYGRGPSDMWEWLATRFEQ